MHSLLKYAYIGYGIVETTDTEQREFIKPGGTFELECLVSPARDAVAENAPIRNEGLEIRAALLALGYLGGLGSRSRKGWGSIQLEELKFPQKSGDMKVIQPNSGRDEIRLNLDGLFLSKGNHYTDQASYSAFTKHTEISLDIFEYNVHFRHCQLLRRSIKTQSVVLVLSQSVKSGACPGNGRGRAVTNLHGVLARFFAISIDWTMENLSRS
jgi:CRISPR/Cas system CMR-associated protein Cmr1 (group 7 of RAMP superfamily)